MKFNEFTQFFSSSRIDRYHNATGKIENKTIELYKANLTISKSFHPLLGILEVIFRNKINDTLSLHFNDPNWIINQKTGFMIDPSLTFTYKKTGKVKTNRFLLKEITRAENRLTKSGANITSGRIISEQTLGFWTDLYEVHNYKLLKGKPIKIFTTLPAGYGRKEVNDELNKIRRFRNRINHNEPICFSGSNVDFTETLEVYNSIINLLIWIDPQLPEFIEDIDEIVKNIKIAEGI
jgi:Abi-like protein